MAPNYGARYIEQKQFVNYCRGLNVKTNARELEHYEKTGIMLPVARVIRPDDYIILISQQTYDDSPERINLELWPDLLRLDEKLRFLPEDYSDLTDDELMHPFDREMGQNPYLAIPTPESYKPWRDYKVSVTYPGGQRLDRTTVDHYYSYWQVHQLYEVQNYPDLYRNKALLDLIPDEIKTKHWLPRTRSIAQLSTFGGKAKNFDALSYWLTAYERERKRTFALVPEKDRRRELDDSQAKDYQSRLLLRASSVLDRFGLIVDDLRSFLFEVVQLYGEYRNDERYKLADELKNDAFAIAQLVEVISGDGWDKISEELGKRSIWVKRDFRHMDTLTKERDEARYVLIRAMEQYADKLTKLGISGYSFKFSDSDVDNLLDYCENQGLSLLLTALSGMVATGDEVREKFRRVTRYTNLKNTLTSLEYLLKEIATRGNVDMKGYTLTPVISSVMSNERGWIMLFSNRVQTGLTGANNAIAFLANLTTLQNDSALVRSEDTFWARVFLTTCLARNGTVHGYPSEDWYYGDLFGEMLDAVIFGILYTWHIAKREDWV